MLQDINLSDTIAAIATSMGESGIGIVRLSGKDVLSAADRIFVSKDGKCPADFKTYTVHYGWIVDRKQKTENRNNLISDFCSLSSDCIIDEVILTVMRGPKSYTKEDVVEISCHGGIVALRRVLDLVLENGCRLAQPGEFTKRAFLNGRIDLAQAEAVLDIIRAKTDSALHIGIEQLKGGLSDEINRIRNSLLDILSVLEANIDFPEEGIDSIDREGILKQLHGINDYLSRILKNSNHGRVFREGIRAVICGKPNVGKSSLLNALLKQERSIVTPIAGTTRDVIEEIIDIKGIPVRIVDTAGIIEPADLIERKAIQRSKKCIDSADLVILLLDNSKRIDRQDEAFMRKLKAKTVLVVINKIDLRQKIERNKILKRFGNIADISAKKGRNINLLEEMIAELVFKGRIKDSESAMVSNLRHIQLIKKSQKFVAETVVSLDNKLSFEFIAQNIKDAVGYLDDLLGKKFSGDLLDRIFSKFCIGK